MKKTATPKTPSKIREDLLPEYIFDYRKAKPNPFTGQKEVAGAIERIGSPETPGKSSGKSSGKTEDQVRGFLSDRPGMTIPELAEALDITTRGVEKQIAKLRQDGRLRRVGPAKGGHWEVIGGSS
jgi:predicted HTH transcriptional regulator